jgi:hypothetical protein
MGRLQPDAARDRRLIPSGRYPGGDRPRVKAVRQS